MFRLIMTNLKYLTFEKLFLIGAAGSLFLGVRGGMTSRDYGFDMEYVIFAVLIIAAVALLNTGRENTDGTLRNKLTLGYSRSQIFASFMISSLICSVVLYLLFSLPFFLIGKDTMTKYMSDERLLLIWAVILCVALLVTVGSVCLTLCIPILPVAAVALLAAAIGFAALSGTLGHRLNESPTNHAQVTAESLDDLTDTESNPPMYDELSGFYVQNIEYPNELYVDSPKRDIYFTLYFLDPYSQIDSVRNIMMMYFDTDVDKIMKEVEKDPEEYKDYTEGLGFHCLEMLGFYPIFSLGFSAVLFTAGLLVFRKRNIN